METENLEKSIKEIFSGRFKYIVPLYQRNFAWRQEQIEQLLQDVYEAYLTNENGNYFIGSLVVLKRANGDYEVIDGQQRLTTLSLITKILRINDAPRLFYDSRPEVEEFFRAFYGSPDGKFEIDYPQTFHLKNAIDYIRTTKLDGKNNSDVTIDSVEESFTTFFSNNVILVQVEIPQDTDVASYFEIMNNRSEQLQKHEILKSRMMSRLSSVVERREFAMIWDACSQMDIPIQKAFDSVEKRKTYFGQNYDDFCFPSWSGFDVKQGENHRNEDRDGYSNSIDYILDKSIIFENGGGNEPDDDYESDSESKYRSIIDFPNFLMHVLKVLFPNKDIPLNEKFLLSQYEELESEINPKDFIQKLVFCRTFFDRYIVKVFFDKNDNEDGEKWALIKPRRYEKSWKYVNTFEEDDKQERIVKALSMLQVTFRTRIYKTWLYEILKWFSEREDDSINVSYKDYIKKLDAIILGNYVEMNYSKIDKSKSLNKDNSYSLGTNTPHYLFNLIDYLYWVDSKNVDSIFGEYPKVLKDFDFKYWNSVEHHMAREWAKTINVPRQEDFIDNLGNLCLISKSTNSRLSDRDVKDKVVAFGNGNLGANRQIIYNMTKDSDNSYTWNEEKIKEHYNELLELLSKRESILAPSASVN